MFAHITTSAAWVEALEAGVYLAPSLEAQGFIHCSEISAEQLLAVANHLYAGQSGLVLLLIETQRLTSAVRYEEFRTSGNFFHHLYGPINLEHLSELRCRNNSLSSAPFSQILDYIHSFSWAEQRR